ncbi:uncharacterized protein CANTADRAFT_7528 [Suhomyces tanzawaensis NRRL Y-17324]|uniref:SH3 domain-containing protein n=1 Tax=Suhomyces tanzawaensis NRRL Y-17324 TaxID=984487 RepID=A0A1E4SF22_9ASCO|nr:uncharacterized protein CANTADRAFT_7528 [Suhomyces tanzawaensis NRRL Y-17324]ODV78065.1 hypothetical protein CANTADRAFT_7528 [Suhomyces tanzawaensis NRRL Y-17324]
MDDSDSKLESTNRLLSDLERKLSFISTTSSAQTQQSAGSSVIINKAMNGIAKQNIQSSVLDYIKNDDDSMFSPNELFQDRQAKFMTTFGKHYNDDVSRQYLKGSVSPNLNPNRSIHIHESDDIDDGELAIESSTPNPHSIHVPIDTIDVDDPEGLDSDDPSNDYDETVNDYEQYQHDEDDDDDENDIGDTDELLVPPSPPRSPPRELDPDKLYGLYDFSGPDPSHCALSRDEPVFLINDEDNYWWLIRKMTKDERIDHKKNTMKVIPDKDEDELDDENYSDEDDGKIGFVPAECLETYGERLARLNCFKNEELERTSKDTFEVYGESENFAIDLTSPIHYQNDSEDSIVSKGEKPDSSTEIVHSISLSKSNSLLKHSALSKSSSLLRRNGLKKDNTKSVTFEDLGQLELEEEEEEQSPDDVEIIREQQKRDFDNGTFDIPHDEIKKSNNLAPPVEEEKISEVLSDIYPEAPLIINKNNKKKKALLPSKLTNIESTGQGPQDSSPFTDFVKPTSYINRDDVSIGSFSPDTPPSRLSKSKRQQYHTPEGAEEDEEDDEFKEITNNLTHLRRSVILDRLTKVTSDIEQQLQLDHYGSSSNELDEVEEVDELDDDHISSRNNETITVLDSTEVDPLETPKIAQYETPRLEQFETPKLEQYETPKFDQFETPKEHLQTPKTEISHAIYNENNQNIPESPLNQLQTEMVLVPDASEVINIDDDYEYEYDFDDEEDEDEDEEDGVEEVNHSGEFTPLTSMNSLSNGVSASIPKSTPYDEKRKSKPVHEMFMPILGKFDKLAEKLAELDSMFAENKRTNQ